VRFDSRQPFGEGPVLAASGPLALAIDRVFAAWSLRSIGPTRSGSQRMCWGTINFSDDRRRATATSTCSRIIWLAGSGRGPLPAAPGYLIKGGQDGAGDDDSGRGMDRRTLTERHIARRWLSRMILSRAPRVPHQGASHGFSRSLAGNRRVPLRRERRPEHTGVPTLGWREDAAPRPDTGPIFRGFLQRTAPAAGEVPQQSGGPQFGVAGVGFEPT